MYPCMHVCMHPCLEVDIDVDDEAGICADARSRELMFKHHVHVIASSDNNGCSDSNVDDGSSHRKHEVE